MQAQRRNALRLFLVGLTAGACTEQTPPTAIPAGVNAAVTAAAGANNQKVKVKTMQLASNTMRIDGPSVTGQVSIGNSGLAIPANVVVRGEITQAAASRRAVNTSTQCSPAPADAGKLPTGTCDMTFAASASNSALGTGTLSPGSATFTLHVIQTSDAGDTELANKSLLVNLVGTPSMTVTIAPLAVLIDGAAATATAVIQNPANSLQGVLLQGWAVQGTAPNEIRRPTGGSLVTCGSNAGVLPPGTCTMTISVAPSNIGPSTGDLVPGDATFRLELIQSSGSTNTTVDVKTVAITLVSNIPHFTRVELQSTALTIGGPSVNFTADIQNGGGPRSNVIVIANIQQSTDGGFVQKQAGGLAVTCGGVLGALPTTGNGVCTVQGTVNAPGDSEGLGALKPGPASLNFLLANAVGVLDRKRFDITLVAPKVATITGITISPTIVLASGSSPYTAILQNTGPTLSNVVLRAWISQGTARRAAGGRAIQCNAGPVGELPTGSCTLPADVAAMNEPASGTGTLLPGPATLEIDLDQQSGATTNLDKVLIPITLVVSSPTIINLELSAPNVLIGESIEYTATLYNPTSQTITAAFIQGYLSQGSIVDFGAGGTDVVGCAGQAELPPGICRVTFTLNTRNLDGAPAWIPGAATFRLELVSGTTLLDAKSRTVFLNQLQ